MTVFFFKKELFGMDIKRPSMKPVVFGLKRRNFVINGYPHFDGIQRQNNTLGLTILGLDLTRFF